MAELKVERRPAPGWLMALAAASLLTLLLFALWWRPVTDRVGTYDPARDAGLAIAYQGQTWIPADVSRAARFPDDQMVLVGEQGGHKLWANEAQGIGGGGGGVNAPDRLKTGPYHRIYVKLGDGRYVPMVVRSEVPFPTRNPIK